MPFDTGVWGEEAAHTGLTGTAALGPTNIGYGIAGDKITVKDMGKGVRVLIQGYGMTGDTKPQGSALVPDNSNANKPFYGPGSIRFFPDGWLDLQDLAIEIQERDSITGQTSSTAVNEGSVLGAHFAYNSPVPRWDLKEFAGFDIFNELMTITSTTPVVYNSGAATVFAASTNTTNWFDDDAVYWLLGVSGHLSAATFGGILHVTNLPGEWAKYAPGIQINGLSAVNFSANQPFTKFLQPIGPISGTQLNTTTSLGMTASSAGAVNFVLRIARVR